MTCRIAYGSGHRARLFSINYIWKITRPSPCNKLKNFLKKISNFRLVPFLHSVRFTSARVPKVRFWPKRYPQNHQFSIGFIRYFDMVQTHVIYSEKRNAFLMILGPFFDFGLQKPSFSIGFIRYFAIRVCVLEKWYSLCFITVLSVLQKCKRCHNFYL